jgi:hypothetical protein
MAGLGQSETKMMSAMTAAFLGSGRRLRVAVAPLAIVDRV